MTRLGAVLAGGRAERFGSDKALALWRGRPLIAHAADILSRHSQAVVVCGRDSAPLALPCLADRPRAGLGPLGGLCAALEHAAANGHQQVLTIGCDMPMIDEALIAALIAPGTGRFLAQAPVVGCWPATLAEPLLRHLETDGDRAVRRWAAAAGVESLDAGAPLANLNTPDDLAALGGG
ncbi:molybdenum cofactor guanylyltransferase [Sphingopyxis indica]|nr:molybdenum cofactor guanylyltransferase [Sphingopyxis indica]